MYSVHDDHVTCIVYHVLAGGSQCADYLLKTSWLCVASGCYSANVPDSGGVVVWDSPAERNCDGHISFTWCTGSCLWTCCCIVWWAL